MEQFILNNKLGKNERFNITIEGVKHKYSIYFDNNFHIWEDRSVDNKQDRKAGRGVIYAVVNGNCVVEKVPFRPKIGEEYWTYGNVSGEGFRCQMNTGDLYDALRIKNNFAFRTREEAEDPKNIARVKEYCEGVSNG